MGKLKKKSANDYRHGDLKASLIRAALESIEKTGEVGFSLRDLSLRAGVTHAAAYRHFSSKKDILVEIAEEGHSQLSEIFSQILKANPEDLVGLGIAYVDFAIRNPVYFKVMFHPDAKVSGTNEQLKTSGQKTFGFLLSAVEANKKSKKFLDQDSLFIAMSAWAGVHGLATLIVNDNLAKKMNFEPIEMAKVLTSHLMNGFLRRRDLL